MARGDTGWYKYEPDHEGINRLARSGGMSKAMVNIAREGSAWGKAHAPKRSGAYAKSIRVEPFGVQAGALNEFRAGARIVSDEDTAIAVEVLFKGGHRTLRESARYLQNKYGTRRPDYRGEDA